MGLTYLSIEVANPDDPEHGEPVRFLIDSGATYSVVPSEVLERLRIKPLRERVFTLANGAEIRRKTGVAVFKYGEDIGGAEAVFGEVGDANLLGAFTLEALGLALDPFKRQLLRLPMMLA